MKDLEYAIVRTIASLDIAAKEIEEIPDGVPILLKRKNQLAEEIRKESYKLRKLITIEYTD